MYTEEHKRALKKMAEFFLKRDNEPVTIDELWKAVSNGIDGVVFSELLASSFRSKNGKIYRRFWINHYDHPNDYNKWTLKINPEIFEILKTESD